jgi:hypothetical protein
MKKEEIKLMEGKDVIRFDFEYGITYEPDLAVIEMKGHLLYMVDPKQTKEILKVWEKSKQVADDIKLNIYNTIFHKCNIKALELEEDFSLPPHLQLPYIKGEEKKATSYTG